MGLDHRFLFLSENSNWRMMKKTYFCENFFPLIFRSIIPGEMQGSYHDQQNIEIKSEASENCY